MNLSLVVMLWLLVDPLHHDGIDLNSPQHDWQRVLDLRSQLRLDEQALQAGRSGGLVLRGGVGFYQSLISSQDASRCQFSPSCSEFASRALGSQGTWRGMLMAMDRIQRCSPFAKYYYPRDHHTGQLLDPLEDYLQTDTSQVHGKEIGGPENIALTKGNGGSDVGHKRPGVAMLLSTIVPGAGKFYAGRPLDGLTNLLGTGIPATFAAINFSRDGLSSARGWFHGTLAVGFYAGNIWGSGEAARQANRSNQRIERTFDDASLGRNFVPEDRQPFRWPLHGKELDTSDETMESLTHDRFDAALMAFADERYNIAAAGFLDLADMAPRTSIGGRARFFQSLAHAESHQWGAARSALLLAPESVFLGGENDRHQALEYLDGLSTRPVVSPTRAAIYSAVLPGTGQIYSHHYAKGIASMAINSLTGYYVYDCVRTESYVELLLTALPLFWRYYRGGILSAASCARNHNESAERKKVMGYYHSLGVYSE